MSPLSTEYRPSARRGAGIASLTATDVMAIIGKEPSNGEGSRVNDAEQTLTTAPIAVSTAFVPAAVLARIVVAEEAGARGR